MIRNLQDSVVLVTSSNPDINRFGTGFLIYRDEHSTYLLTCAHVVSDVGPDTIEVDNRPAVVVASGAEQGLDLAVLRVDGMFDNRPLLKLHVSGKEDRSFVIAGYQLFGRNYLIREINGELGGQVGLRFRNRRGRTKAWDLKIVDDFHLEPGYSGSPVVDETNGYALGIVSHRQGSGEKGIAISIEAIKKVWPEMTSTLLQQNVLSTSERERRIQNVLSTSERERRIDALAPGHTKIGETIRLLVQVRFPNDPLLGSKDWPTKRPPPSVDQDSKQMVLKHPIDPETGIQRPAHLEIEVVTPCFEVHGAKKQLLEVPPDQPSEIIQFLLTATRLGACPLNVVVHAADEPERTISLDTIISDESTTPMVKIETLVITVVVAGDDTSQSKNTEAAADQSAAQKAPPASSSETQETSKTKQGWHWEKIGAIAGIIAAIVAISAFAISADLRSLIFSTPTPTASPTVTPSPIQASDLVVRVFDVLTNEPVSQVEVVFFPEDSADYQTKVTDDSGVVRFSNAIDKEKKFVRVTVTDTKYARYDKTTTIDRNNPVFDVFLQPK